MLFMAVGLGGETLRNVAGLNPFQHRAEAAKQYAGSEGSAAKVMDCRWLIIGEISMVSASLLARVDSNFAATCENEASIR